jgi:acyl-CoA thioester hydrolase
MEPVSMIEGLSAEVELEVPFHDVDAMGVAWHGHYLKYLEIARTAMMRKVGLDFQQMKDSGHVWPVVECHLKYVKPLRYGQKVKVRAWVVEHESRLKVAYLITDAATGTKLNKATTTQVAITSGTGELIFDLEPLFAELARYAQ